MVKADMSSFISWIDLSDEDQKRARDYLRSLAEGTLDELGFGVIRDTFADIFFPATSTIMTRARYYILVPSIHIYVLQQELTGSKAQKKCDKIEKHLRRTLIANKSIKNARKENVQRYPASIYWAGLRRLKILRQTGSQARYFSQLESHFSNHVLIKDDDKNTHLEHEGGELWHPELVQLYDGGHIPKPVHDHEFDEDVDFRVRPVEAKFLKARFLDDPFETVISNVFKKDSFENAAYPWDWDYPASLERQMTHARQFSMISKIATLLYYQMVNDRRVELEKPSIERDVAEIIEHWFAVARTELIQWEIEDFLWWAEEENCLRRNDFVFFTKFLESIRSAVSAKSFSQSNAVQNLIFERERAKRPSKRRLMPGRFQNEWKLPGQFEGYFSAPEHLKFHLNFRSGIASQIVGEIFEGLADVG